MKLLCQEDDSKGGWPSKGTS